jgi:hypothetical protein
MAGGRAPDTSTSSDDPQPSIAAPMTMGVSGVVLCRSGRPLRGVVVLVRSTGGSSPPIPDIANTTDADGRYHWSLPPGAYELTFVNEGTTIAKRDVVVPAAGRGATVDVVVEACGNL